jgi:hypothetical protein
MGMRDGWNGSASYPMAGFGISSFGITEFYYQRGNDYIFKSRSLQWVGNVTRSGKARNVYTISKLYHSENQEGNGKILLK